MRTIYIDPETWGPNYLWHPSVFVDWDEETGADIRRPAMCCLGFACHQLGIPLDLLDFVGLPSELEHPNKPLSAEVETFITRCQHTVSEDFAESVLKLIGPPSSDSDDDYTIWKYEDLLAKVNDWYHELNDEDKPSKLEPTLEVLKLGFKKMGYELVYGKPTNG